MPKKILIIAYEFPPVVASGMYHPYYLAKYLRQFGWEPFVLTGSTAAPHELDDHLDMAAHLDKDHVIRAGLADEKALVRFIRNDIKHPDLESRLLRHHRPDGQPFVYFFPDPLIRWLPEAYRAAERLIEKHRIDVVITTSFPFSAVLLGRLLQKVRGVPWVVEFRDLWTEDPRFPGVGEGFLEDSQWLEEQVLDTADAIVAVSEPLTARFSKRLGKNREKFHTIELSYEDAEFPVERDPSTDRFSLLHVGTIYPGMLPPALIKAVEMLLALGKIDKKRFEMTIAGLDLTGKAGYFESLGFRVAGHLPHREVLPLYRKASLQLLTLPESLKEFIPSRIFEYMASGAPVLGVLPDDSVAAELIRRSRTGQVVDIGAEVHVLAGVLHDVYTRWEKGGLELNPDLEFIRRFSSATMAGRWAELLRRAL